MNRRSDTSEEKPAVSDPADMEHASDKLFCCRWMRHRVPQTHRDELYHILRMTGPLVRNDAVSCFVCERLYVN